MNTEDVLKKVGEIIGARDSTHGTKTDSFQRHADYMAVYLAHKTDATFTARDSIMSLLFLKIARLESMLNSADTPLDMVGYCVKLCEEIIKD